MISWLFPRPPLDIVEKAWTETRMLWLAEQFGIARMIGTPVVMPADEFLEASFDGSKEAAERLLERVCTHLQVDPKQIELQIGEAQHCSSNSPGAIADAKRAGTVRVDQHELHDQEGLVANMARDIAQVMLSPAARSIPSQREIAWLTDLLPVFLGLGVFVANSAVRESSLQNQNSCGCSSRRRDFLPARMVGYAMALFAAVRGDAYPGWKASLRLDALTTYTGGLRYLRRTSDSIFTCDNAAHPRREMPTSDLLNQLANGSPSTRIAALWDLRDPRHAVVAERSGWQMLARSATRDP